MVLASAGTLSLSTISNTIYINTSNGYVGIATTSPAYHLDVNGNIRTNGWLRTSGATGLYNDTHGIGWYMTDTSWLRTYNNASIWADTGYICTNGSMGVGTSAPSYTLHINAAVGSYSVYQNNGTLYFPNNGAGPYWGSAYSRMYDNGQFYIFTDDNLHFDNGGTTDALFFKYDTGYWGIGTTTPNYPIHITRSNNATLSYGYLNSGGATGTASGTVAYAVYANGRILCPEFDAMSDIRIKTNITDLNSSESLQIINTLKPKNFEYIDNVTHNKLSSGFIAQEVQLLIPNAVSESTHYIPNIYCLADIIDGHKKNGSKLSLHHKLSNDIKQLNLPFKLKIYLDEHDNEKEVTVTQIINDKTIIVKENLFEVHNTHRYHKDTNKHKKITKIFVYGTQVNDFKAIDYDYIFTLGISAIKELDNRLQNIKNQIKLINRNSN
jgi:hypothetical protein